MSPTDIEPDWDAFAAILDAAAAPLLAAGWGVVQIEKEWDPDYGHWLSFELWREGRTISIEYYSDDVLLAFEENPLYDPATDDPSDPLFTIPDPTAEKIAPWYSRSGWI